MPYRVEDLRPGQVLLMVPSSHEPIWDRALDEAIKISSGPFVHAALVGHGELIEQLSIVQTSALDKYCDNGWAYTVNSTKTDAVIDWALSHLGQVYGVEAILEDGLMYDLHDWNMLDVDPRYVTCSGFIERAWRLGGGVPLIEHPLPSPTSLAYSPNLIGPRPWTRLSAI